MCGGWLKSCRTGQCHERVYLQVTGPNDVHIQGIDGEGFVFEIHLTTNKKNSSQPFLSQAF